MKDLVPTKEIERLIFEFRGVQVMIDNDLATLYGTQTRKLKQQVKRNPGRFPEDFMFELTKEEKAELIARNPRLENLKFSPVQPLAFTEHGVLMLSSVLGSETAIAVNIQVMRVFTQMRAALAKHGDLLLKLEKLSGTVSHHSRDIKVIFGQLRRMREEREEEETRRLLAQVAKDKAKKEKKKHRPVVGFKVDKDKK
ncbi:MAG: ORF6N domain-containing protein [Bacteroidetes bacterium]|nr:ORF6N domain-containing protein [Bacteroidota bacterium]